MENLCIIERRRKVTATCLLGYSFFPRWVRFVTSRASVKWYISNCKYDARRRNDCYLPRGNTLLSLETMNNVFSRFGPSPSSSTNRGLESINPYFIDATKITLRKRVENYSKKKKKICNLDFLYFASSQSRNIIYICNIGIKVISFTRNSNCYA